MTLKAAQVRPCETTKVVLVALTLGTSGHVIGNAGDLFRVPGALERPP
jgi:hypothetical protein